MNTGEVAYADIPRDGYRSRGFGIVRFNNVAEAQKAVDMFNNYELNGRIINVREDNSPRDFKAPTKPRTFGGNNGGSTRPAGGNNGGFAAAKAGTKVFVGNLPWSVTWQTLKDLAKEKGLNPIRAEVAIGDNGKSRGWGTLQFDSTDEADAAIGMNVLMLSSLIKLIRCFEWRGRVWKTD